MTHKKCEHGKYKEYCVPCKGSALCEHNKRKAYCKDCGGSQICEHGKQKPKCKECGGIDICEHGKRKSICKDCGGIDICEHGRQKYICKECDGVNICKHSRQKNICKECGGVNICKHGKQINYCKECGGSQMCEHGKRKCYCNICDGKYLCKSEWCETIVKSSKYNGYCLSCCIQLCPDIQVSRNYKTKENDVVNHIKHHFPEFTWVCDKRIKDGCSKRRPDLLLDMGYTIIIVEVDENRHNDYDCSCEHKRLMELSQDLNFRPITFIRFNPDEYTNNEGVIIKSCWKTNNSGLMQIKKTKQKEWETRISILKEQISYWINNPTEKTVEIVELFY